MIKVQEKSNSRSQIFTDTKIDPCFGLIRERIELAFVREYKHTHTLTQMCISDYAGQDATHACGVKCVECVLGSLSTELHTIPGLSIIRSVCQQFSVFKRLSTFSCPMTSGLAMIIANKHSVTWIGNLKPFYFLLKAKLQPLNTGPRGAGALRAETKQGRP